jgi:hypothetical protein
LKPLIRIRKQNIIMESKWNAGKWIKKGRREREGGEN